MIEIIILTQHNKLTLLKIQIMKKLIIISSFAVSALLISCGGEEKNLLKLKQQLLKSNLRRRLLLPSLMILKEERENGQAESLALMISWMRQKKQLQGETTAGVKCGSCHKYTDEN